MKQQKGGLMSQPDTHFSIYTGLIALVLITIVIVPIVSAAEKEKDTTSLSIETAATAIDTKQMQLPKLQFEKSKKYVNVTGELSPKSDRKAEDSLTIVSASKNTVPSEIPYGAIIYHSKDGVTTVFDSKGQQLFAAEDSKSRKVKTPKGLIPSTFIHEVPDKSVIVNNGSILYVFNNKNRILTVIDDNNGNINNFETYIPSTLSPQWIEWAETESIPTVGQFTARWNVPVNPTQVNYHTDGTVYHGSTITIWNGLETPEPGLFLLQPVLEWYIKDKPTDPNPSSPYWTMAVWYLWGTTGNEVIHSSRSAGISSGDQMQGNIELNTMGYDAIASITDLSPNGGGSSTLFLTENTAPNIERMPYQNLKATVVLEGWDPTKLQGLSKEYLCGPVTFQNFVLTDSDRVNIISTTPINSGINTQYWNPSIFGLSVNNQWPNTITLNTGNQQSPPVASFTSSSPSGTIPLTVTYTDTSINNPTSWSWTFGDGYSSNTRNPSHTYSTEGTYTVSLMAANSAGSNTNTKSGYISVSSPPTPTPTSTPVPAPTAGFTATPTAGTSPVTVQFNDTSTNTPTAWSWNFGDGNMSAEQNPAHTYALAGNYTISLTAANAGGSNTTIRANYITLQPRTEVRIGSGNISLTGGNTTLALNLTFAPKGLSGYNVNLSVSNSTVAQITAVSFPSWASSMNSAGPLPATQDVMIKASDVNSLVGIGAVDTPLANVTVRGLSPGVTEITLSRTNFDDDDGTDIPHMLVNGTLTVG